MEKNLVIGQNPRSLKSRWDLDPKNQEHGIYACIYIHIHIYICTYIHTDMYAYTYAPCSRLRDGEGGLEARCENACVVQEVLQYVLQCVLSFAFCASVGGETRDQSNLSFSMSVFLCVAVRVAVCCSVLQWGAVDAGNHLYRIMQCSLQRVLQDVLQGMLQCVVQCVLLRLSLRTRSDTSQIRPRNSLQTDVLTSSLHV